MVIGNLPIGNIEPLAFIKKKKKLKLYCYLHVYLEIIKVISHNIYYSLVGTFV